MVVDSSTVVVDDIGLQVNVHLLQQLRRVQTERQESRDQRASRSPSESLHVGQDAEVTQGLNHASIHLALCPAASEDDVLVWMIRVAPLLGRALHIRHIDHLVSSNHWLDCRFVSRTRLPLRHAANQLIQVHSTSCSAAIHGPRSRPANCPRCTTSHGTDYTSGCTEERVGAFRDSF